MFSFSIRGVIGVFLLSVVLSILALYSLPLSFEMMPASEHKIGKMKAVRYRVPGEASVLTLEVVAAPVPKVDQVVVEVEFASLNPCDFKFRRNSFLPMFFRPLPKTPGADISGRVVEAPQGSKYKVGDQVAAMLPLVGPTRWGALAQLVAVDERFVAKVPQGISLLEAAAFPLVSLTVVQAFESMGAVATASTVGAEASLAGKRVLVHAGAGGVGSFAIQYAKHVLGAAFVATTCSGSASGKHGELVTSLGADLVLDYRSEDFERNVLSSGPFDVVFDTMSWLYEDLNLKALVGGDKPVYLNILSSDWAIGSNGVERANGVNTILNLLFSRLQHGVKHVLNTLGVSNIISSSSLVPEYRLITVVPNGKQLSFVLNLVSAGTIRAVLDDGPLDKAGEHVRFTLADTAAAYTHLEQGHASGKVMIQVK
jgi:alcohol dehydrogenase